MRITQKKIADLAGVSQTTVSMVLRENKGFSCSPAVRDKVMRAAHRLRYAMPKHRTHNLGLLVRPGRSGPAGLNVYHSRFFHGMVERATALGYHLLAETYDSGPWPPNMLTGRKIDGLIVRSHLASRHRASDLVGRLPVVMLNCCEPNPGVVSIMPDNADGLARSVRHLHDLGHRRIAYFGLPGPPVGSIHNRERYEGYRGAMQMLGLEVPSEFVRLFAEIPSSEDALVDQTAEIVDHFMNLPEPPTAVLSNGDLFILSLMSVARARRWRIPADLSVIGFDNDPACLHSHPPLSSIQQPMEEMGAAAVDEAVRQIEGRAASARQIRYPVELVLRASTAPVH